MSSLSSAIENLLSLRTASPNLTIENLETLGLTAGNNLVALHTLDASNQASAIQAIATAISANTNVHSMSELQTIINSSVDAIALAPVFSTVATSNVINAHDQSVTISGSAEAGASISLSFDSASAHQLVADSSGNWSYTVDSAAILSLGDGQHTLTAIQTDIHANVSIAASKTFLIDTTAPIAPTTNLATDTGSNTSDGITNTPTVINVNHLEVGATWKYQIDNSGTWINGSGASFALQAGSHSYIVQETDSAGNSTTTSPISYFLDTTAPSFTSLTTASINDSGNGIAAGATVYTAAATDAGSGGVSYSLSGTDSGWFNINSSTGVVSFKNQETYAATHDAGGNHGYDFSVTATDIAGNSATRDVALTMGNFVTYTSQSLYSDVTHLTGVGKLIARSGNNYFWDFNGDGLTNDFKTHDYLDGIFKYASDFVTVNPSGAGADTTDTYRYGLLYTSTGGTVKVALLTSLQYNAMHSSGVPAGWANSLYWSASQTSTGGHGFFSLDSWTVNDGADTRYYYVAVQVL